VEFQQGSKEEKIDNQVRQTEPGNDNSQGDEKKAVKEKVLKGIF
jgi:hypothetical protein